ncbi:MAG: hypothetical protein J6A57_00880 [Ruminococcus sp.]|nr:hypothetical protein [Ruminococcus sp.]
MKKIIRIVLIILIAISAVIMCCNAYNLFNMRNGEKADCTISFVGLPDGVVFGDFVDSDGVQHIEEPLYTDYFLQGHRNNVEYLYGKHITIIYDKQNNIIINYDNTIQSIIINLLLIIIYLGLFGIFYLIKRKAE